MIKNFREKTTVCLLLVVVAGHAISWARNTNESAAVAPPGSLKLLESYKHEKLQGIDSLVGKIKGAKGFEIFYEIGRVCPPGEPRMGGDFSDRALFHKNKDDVEWFATQKVGGQRVNMVLLEDGNVVASFPDSGANFSAKTSTRGQLADFLTMVLTYPAEEK